MLRFSGKWWATIVALAIIAMVSQLAVAQNEKGQRGRGGRGGGPGGPGGPGGFLSMARLATVDKVQDELKLTDEQKSKIEKINDEMRDEMRKALEAGGRPDFEKMRKMRDDMSSKLNDVLDEGQRKRLTGIFVQVAGPAAVMDPAVAKELNVTDEQKTKLRDSMMAMREGRGQDSQTSPEDRRAKMDKQISAVLTSEQQQKLESLKGAKVDIDISALRGPGGGGRPPRGEGRPRANRGREQSEEKKTSS